MDGMPCSPGGAGGSEAVDLDRGGGDALLDEKVGDLLALVALELDDLAHLLVVDERAVARELLLERLEQLLGVVFCGRG
jgi:hypothetical protein